ncbi:spore germination protein GerPE [Paenibacillus nanensis]|nr:spore germination protein GerPE [Paenibacillus nanensis]
MNPNENRTSHVGVLRVIGATSATMVQIGDRGETDGRIRALAVQREEGHLTAGEVFFESYAIFSRPVPVLSDPAYESGQLIQTKRSNVNPCIRVGCIRVTAAAAASSIQIGNGNQVRGESRIKHIRQYAVGSGSLQDQNNPLQNGDETTQ